MLRSGELRMAGRTSLKRGLEAGCRKRDADSGKRLIMKIFLDGKLVPENQAKVSVFDHGLLYGDGVFEGIRVYSGKIFEFEAHIKRLYESAKAINLKIP